MLSGCNSAVEYLLPKQGVEGSNPFTRSMFGTPTITLYYCKAVHLPIEPDMEKLALPMVLICSHNYTPLTHDEYNVIPVTIIKERYSSWGLYVRIDH